MNTPLSLLALVCVMASSALAQPIIAHRGASHDAPENTLAAFKLAWEQGADGIEGDFYLTKDGQIACLHDKDTKRTSPNSPALEVTKSTLEQLRAADVGAWKNEKFKGEKIPTLDEVLATVPEKKLIYIEIKCGPEILPAVEAALKRASSVKPEQIVIISFNESVIAAARQRFPNIRAIWLTSFKQNEKTGDWKPSRAAILKTLAEIKATGVSVSAKPGSLSAEDVAAIRKAGYEFHCWTIDDAKLARQYRSLGAQSITTNRPAALRKSLEAKER